jgi:hypothetical protein
MLVLVENLCDWVIVGLEQLEDLGDVVREIVWSVGYLSIPTFEG